MSTILLIDDNDVLRQEVRGALEGAAIFSRILEARDGFEGLRLLMGETVDVVLLDLDMAKLDGEKLMRMRDSSPGGANIPFIFLTAGGNLEGRTRVLCHGASDAIEKPVHLPELVARLRLHLKVKRLQDELMLKNATLAQLSTVDGLTGLRTRRFIDELLSIEFLRARRYHTPLSVLLGDIDHFKRVNDQYGHLAGDEVLRGISELVRGLVRGSDVAGRYGGEELIVVGPQNPALGAAVLAERMRETVEAARFEADGQKIGVTLSVGVAEYDDAMTSPEDLIALADRELYTAKRKGRNRISVASGR